MCQVDFVCHWASYAGGSQHHPVAHRVYNETRLCTFHQTVISSSRSRILPEGQTGSWLSEAKGSVQCWKGYSRGSFWKMHNEPIPISKRGLASAVGSPREVQGLSPRNLKVFWHFTPVFLQCIDSVGWVTGRASGL